MQEKQVKLATSMQAAEHQSDCSLVHHEGHLRCSVDDGVSVLKGLSMQQCQGSTQRLAANLFAFKMHVAVTS